MCSRNNKGFSVAVIYLSLEVEVAQNEIVRSQIFSGLVGHS